MYTLNLRANDNGQRPDLNWSEYPIEEDAPCVDNLNTLPLTFRTLILVMRSEGEGSHECVVTEVSTGTTVRVLY